MVLVTRYLKDRLQADITARQVRKSLNPKIVGHLELDFKKGLLTNLEDIIDVLDKRQWERFETRFKLLR